MNFFRMCGNSQETTVDLCELCNYANYANYANYETKSPHLPNHHILLSHTFKAKLSLCQTFNNQHAPKLVDVDHDDYRHVLLVAINEIKNDNKDAEVLASSRSGS